MFYVSQLEFEANHIPMHLQIEDDICINCSLGEGAPGLEIIKEDQEVSHLLRSSGQLTLYRKVFVVLRPSSG